MPALERQILPFLAEHEMAELAPFAGYLGLAPAACCETNFYPVLGYKAKF